MISAKERADALEASRLLQSEFLARILDELENWYVEMWKKLDNPEYREKVWYQQNGLQIFRKSLNQKLTDAQMKTGGKDEEINAAVRAARRK